ncbi:glutamate-rich protein 4 [Rhynchocyon petersi]
MEKWKQLKQVGLVPLELGPPPRALTGAPPERRPAEIFLPQETDTGGIREKLLWIWEELANLRRVDVQLLGQLCILGLEMSIFREELAAILEDEEEEAESGEEEAGQLQRTVGQEDLEAYCLVTRLPDFEMTI